MRTHRTYACQKQGQTLALTGLVSSHLKRGCENPRDKLYAMLPMLEHAGGFDSNHIQPNCDMSPWEMLWEYVRTIRFPAEPERRRNSLISAGFELWTGFKTFGDLVPWGFFRGQALPSGTTSIHQYKLRRPVELYRDAFRGLRYASQLFFEPGICTPGS